MTSYLMTFAVYTSAMIGFIFLALFAYKKFSPSSSRMSTSQFLEVEDCVSLGVRKQLYVVRAGNEKFLIASDAERTVFLSKLESSQQPVEQTYREITSYDYDIQNLYSSDREYSRKDAREVLRNIVSSGERR